MIGYLSKNYYCMAYTNTSSNASIMFPNNTLNSVLLGNIFEIPSYFASVLT